MDIQILVPEGKPAKKASKDGISKMLIEQMVKKYAGNQPEKQKKGLLLFRVVFRSSFYLFFTRWLEEGTRNLQKGEPRWSPRLPYP